MNLGWATCAGTCFDDGNPERWIFDADADELLGLYAVTCTADRL